MVQPSGHTNIIVDAPSIDVQAIPEGYTIRSLKGHFDGARASRAILRLLCLAVMAVGIAVWFVADQDTSDNLLILIITISVIAMAALAAWLWFTFVPTKEAHVAVDLPSAELHQVFTDNIGTETGRRTIAFDDIKSLEVLPNRGMRKIFSPVERATSARLVARFGRRKSLPIVWGDASDLETLRSRMNNDILGT